MYRSGTRCRLLATHDGILKEVLWKERDVEVNVKSQLVRVLAISCGGFFDKSYMKSLDGVISLTSLAHRKPGKTLVSSLGI